MTTSILTHKGQLSFNTIDLLLTRFKLEAEEKSLNFKAHKRAISIMIEALENVHKYSDLYSDFVESNKEYMPTFELVINEESLKLKTSNPVLKKDVKKLKSNIDAVNDKSRQELKQYYIETITNGKFSSKGGAGLGFIEMARTSGHKLNYTFTTISEQFSLYTFEVTLNI